MRGYKDSTADNAIRSAMREQRYMADLAVRIRESNASPYWKETQSKRFTGIYSRLLTDPIGDVKQLSEGIHRYAYRNEENVSR